LQAGSLRSPEVSLRNLLLGLAPSTSSSFYWVSVEIFVFLVKQTLVSVEIVLGTVENLLVLVKKFVGLVKKNLSMEL
jgi:hypothetical protein